MVENLLIEAISDYVKLDPMIFLDYDGTLVPIIMNPENSYADEDLISILSDLKSIYNTYIVTGRSPEEIRRFIPIDINLVCYHGACSIINGKTLFHNGSDRFKGIFDTIYRESQGLISIFPGLRIYKKDLAVLYHMGLMQESMKPELEKAVADLASRHGVEVYRGKMIFELRVPGVDKGTAIASIRNGRPAIIAGDDATDETAFSKNRDAMTIKVGSDPSAAKYRIKDYMEMREILRFIIRIAAGAKGNGTFE